MGDAPAVAVDDDQRLGVVEHDRRVGVVVPVARVQPDLLRQRGECGEHRPVVDEAAARRVLGRPGGPHRRREPHQRVAHLEALDDRELLGIAGRLAVRVVAFERLHVPGVLVLGHEEREPGGVVELVAVLVGPQPQRVLDAVGDPAEGVAEPVGRGVAPALLPRVVVEAVAVEVDGGEAAGVEGGVDRGEDVDRARGVARRVEVRGGDDVQPRAVRGHPPDERRPRLAQVGHRLEPAVAAGLLEVVAVGEQGALAQVRVERQAQEPPSHRRAAASTARAGPGRGSPRAPGPSAWCR